MSQDSNLKTSMISNIIAANWLSFLTAWPRIEMRCYVQRSQGKFLSKNNEYAQFLPVQTFSSKMLLLFIGWFGFC